MRYPIIIFLFIVSTSVLAKTNIQLNQTITPPIVDGVLDDKSWQYATEINNLKQVWPKLNLEQHQPTKVLMLFDSEKLYIAATIATPQNEVVANTLQYNQDISSDDRITILLDTFNSERNAYWFEVNANGVKNDGLLVNNTQSLSEWDSIWYAESVINDLEWSVEIAIPFNALSFDPSSEQWGLNIVQHKAGTQAEYRWSNHSQDVSFDDPKQFGKVRGFKELSQGKGIDVRYSLALRNTNTAENNEVEAIPSLDVFYKLTPAISTALTLNTDFSTTEVDDRQVNIGRFDLFMPEKRNFFLQDAGIFEFGGLAKNGRPFFSRKIGLDNQGKALDVNHGIKFSGYGEDWGFGLMTINTDGLDGAKQQLSVTRATFQMNNDMQAGVIVTDGDPYSENSSQTFGADFTFRNNQFLTNKTLEWGTWLQKSNNNHVNGDDLAWGANIAYPNDIINLSLDFMELQKNFNPALGFVNRNNIRNYAVQGHYRHHINQSGIRLIDHSTNINVTTGLNDELKSSKVYFNYLDVTAETGSFLRLAVEDSRENLDAPFKLLGQIEIPVADYHYNRYWFIYQSTTANKWVIDAQMHLGDYYDGKKKTGSVELTWKPTLNFNTSLKLKYDDISVQQQNLEVSQYKFTLDYIFDNRISWQNTFQYDDLSRKLGASSRFKWVHDPGFETHLVFNANYLNDETSWQMLTEQFTINFGGVWRL